MSVLRYWLSIRDKAPQSKWTSKAENGRIFRRGPPNTEVNALRRQFKKPRRSVEEVEVETAQVVIEVVETEVQVDETGRDLSRYERMETEVQVVTEVEEDSVIEVAEDSDGSEDNIPFSELKEKIVAEREGDEDYTQLPDPTK